jgi:hypothetical protein
MGRRLHDLIEVREGSRFFRPASSTFKSASASARHGLARAAAQKMSTIDNFYSHFLDSFVWSARRQGQGSTARFSSAEAVRTRPGSKNGELAEPGLDGRREQIE